MSYYAIEQASRRWRGGHDSAVGEKLRDVHAIAARRSRAQVNKVLVGNKSDNQSARQVSTQEGQALAAEYDVRFIEASAKADVNVTEAFQAIAQQVIDRIPRGMSRPASRQLSSKKSSKKSCSC